MKALILAAGYATRLYPLTKEYPKPLLKVKERPIISHIFDKLKVQDAIDEVIVVTNSKFMPQFEKWQSGLKTEKPLTLVDDLTRTHEDKRGAIGDMHFAIDTKRLQDDLLVVGGDNLFDADLGGFLSFAEGKTHPVIGAYDIKDREQAKKYGVIKVDGQKRIIDFQEKPQAPESTLIAMCLYYFPKEKLGLIQEYVDSEKEKQDTVGFYIDWLRRKVPVYGFVFGGSWYDIGDHKFYHEAKTGFSGK